MKSLISITTKEGVGHKIKTYMFQITRITRDIVFIIEQLKKKDFPLTIFSYRASFKKNVTNFCYPHALNMEYFYLNLPL